VGRFCLFESRRVTEYGVGGGGDLNKGGGFQVFFYISRGKCYLGARGESERGR